MRSKAEGPERGSTKTTVVRRCSYLSVNPDSILRAEGVKVRSHGHTVSL